MHINHLFLRGRLHALHELKRLEGGGMLPWQDTICDWSELGADLLGWKMMVIGEGLMALVNHLPPHLRLRVVSDGPPVLITEGIDRIRLMMNRFIINVLRRKVCNRLRMWNPIRDFIFMVIVNLR